jgi:hypothetical protein
VVDAERTRGMRNGSGIGNRKDVAEVFPLHEARLTLDCISSVSFARSSTKGAAGPQTLSSACHSRVVRSSVCTRAKKGHDLAQDD